MKKWLSKQAESQVNKIQSKTQRDCETRKENYVNEEKQKLIDRHEKDLKKEEVNCKIERSQNTN